MSLWLLRHEWGYFRLQHLVRPILVTAGNEELLISVNETKLFFPSEQSVETTLTQLYDIEST